MVQPVSIVPVEPVNEQFAAIGKVMSQRGCPVQGIPGYLREQALANAATSGAIKAGGNEMSRQALNPLRGMVDEVFDQVHVDGQFGCAGPIGFARIYIWQNVQSGAPGAFLI